MENTNLSAIMKRAWEIKKENRENIFSICLKMAWSEFKKLKVTWKIVSDAADKYVEENGIFVNGWYTKWYANNWQKNDMDRTYVEIREYRNGSLRCSHKCGYWDNVKNEYVAYARGHNVINLLAA